MTGIRDISVKQRDRAQQLKHPLEVELKHRNEHATTQGIRNHLPANRLNKRNKFNRINEVRQRYKMDQIEQKREKITEKQNIRDMHNQLEQQRVPVDIETLIDEEQEMLQIDALEQELEDYEQLLEDYFTQLDLNKI